METPEETYNRILKENGYDPDLSIEKEFNISKSYHSERLKIEMPTEENIKEQAKEWYNETGFHDASPFSYIKGVNWLKNKLLKGI